MGGRSVDGSMREIRESVAEADHDSVCLSVVNAVARATGTDPSKLEPLAGAVDPDMLERLVADAGAGRADGGTIAFTMAGCRVEVDSGGDITVTRPDAPAAPTAPTDADGRSRYAFTAFTDELGAVAVLYDTRNPDAWIQSTSPAAVER